ncbi:hypothetical protein KCU65_g4235, partial [Aureobasidium melanogenum]
MDTDTPSMIVVMGVTGSGKSHFINQIAGREVVQEGASLHSCTQECQLIPIDLGHSQFLLLDTPGFDDTNRSDTEVLSEIARILAAQYEIGVQLKGIIYLQRITDIKMSGSSMKTLQIFQRICGETALTNVLLVTTRWSEIEESLGASREQDLEKINNLRAKEIQHLQCEKADLAKEIDDIRRAADKLQANMRKKEVSFAPQLLDNEVLSKIGTLMNKIKSWSKYFKGSTSGPAVQPDEESLHVYRNVFLGIVDLNPLGSMLEDRKRRRLFVRGLTAYIMCLKIFPASPTKLHHGSGAPDRSIDPGSAKSFSALENTMLTSDLPDGKVNDWRALTFHLFSMLKQTDSMNGLVQAEIHKICDSITTLINPWCQADLDHQQVHQELFDIFDEGVRISQLLRQQRAYWTIRFPQVIRTNVSAPGGVLPFDRAWMEDECFEDTMSQGMVDIVVTPAVFKKGNADGESLSNTYGHSQLKTGHPVRSAIHKQLNGRLVLRWVTTWESLLL